MTKISPLRSPSLRLTPGFNTLYPVSSESHEFEVVSWWDRGDYRLGLSHKVRPRHEMSIPVADTIRLPTSTSAGLYVEIPFKEDKHLLTVGAMRESWESEGASMQLPWRSSRDNQVKVEYAITF